MATQAQIDQTKLDLEALKARLERHAMHSAQTDGPTLGEVMAAPFAWWATVGVLAMLFVQSFDVEHVQTS